MCRFNAPKKAIAQKISKRSKQETTEEKKKRNEKTKGQNKRKHVAKTQNLRGEGKLDQTTQSATKKVRCCFALSN